jgi:hypothetical protein
MNKPTRLLPSRPHTRTTVQRKRANLFFGKGAIRKAIRLDDDPTSIEVHDCAAAIARLHRHAATGGHGAPIVGDRLASTLRHELR